MAEQQQGNSIAAAFPTPPPFYKHFTSENLSRLQTLLSEGGSSDQSNGGGGSRELADVFKPTLRLLNLPAELRYLQPPEPPANGIYRSFGAQFDLNETLPTLEQAGVKQLYNTTEDDHKHEDRAFYLKKLAKSILLNFLELVGVLSVNPDHYAEKIQDLRTHFINFHHLLNEYRPHQARESLIMMMEDQLERSNRETEGIMEMKKKVEGVIQGLGQVDTADMGTPMAQDTDDEATTRAERETNAWDELEKEFT